MTTILAASVAPIPALRLVTGSSVAETRVSGARAGRGPVELILPDVPTVSREHARFTFSDGRWWISNQGRNGLILNGAPVTGEQSLSDGDAIRWGTNPDAPLSRVGSAAHPEVRELSPRSVRRFWVRHRHGETGWPRVARGSGVASQWRQAAFPVVSGAG